MNIYSKNGKILGKFIDSNVVDMKGRTHITIKSTGEILLERYVDTSEEFKQVIALLYNNISSENIESTMEFLNFKDNQFCS